MSERYEHLPIERKWQKIWDDTHFLVDVGDSPADWDTIDVTIDDIGKVKK